jgi:hypothetical protein
LFEHRELWSTLHSGKAQWLRVLLVVCHMMLALFEEPAIPYVRQRALSSGRRSADRACAQRPKVGLPSHGAHR